MSHACRSPSRGASAPCLRLLPLAALAAFAWAAGLAASAWAAAADAGAGEPAARAALPPRPAFYTVSVSRLRVAEPDAFTVVLDPAKPPVRIRLADATCEDLTPSQRELALALATDLLRAEPLWIFPCAAGEGAGGEWRARVWTRKGWLSEVLINAHFAKRRTDQDAGSPVPADQVPETAGDVPPFPPAFAAAVSSPTSGDTFEVTRDGKPCRVRLFDVTCEGAGSAEDARAAAARLLGSGPVWIFPSTQRRLGPNEALPVRIWTDAGWLSEALVKARLAKRLDDPGAVAEADVPKPTPTKSPTTPKPAYEPHVDWVWREVPVSDAGISDPYMCESNVFHVTSPVWRLSWDMKPVRTGAKILVHICRVDAQWETKTSSTYVRCVEGSRGSVLMRTKPGDYWLQVNQSSHINAKVEVQEPVDKSK